MAWVYHCVLWISLLHIVICSERDGEPEQNWMMGNRRLAGSYKIVNRKPFVNKRGADNGIVFPEISSRAGEDNSIEIPDECKRIGICENIPNYPDELVNSILKDLEGNSTMIFNQDILPPPTIAERIGPEEQNFDLCTSTERIFTPRAALDSDNNWQIIFNPKKEPRQSFRIEVCNTIKEKEPPCAPNIVFFQTNYGGRCVQKYTLRQMFVVKNNKKELVQVPLRVPSCCSCVALIL